MHWLFKFFVLVEWRLVRIGKLVIPSRFLPTKPVHFLTLKNYYMTVMQEVENIVYQLWQADEIEYIHLKSYSKQSPIKVLKKKSNR